MGRCLQLAENGKGTVAPNPMVGCVIVRDGNIIGEGWHHRFGEAHAEVNAINSVKDSSLIPGSTVYVSLEPCAHYGKTPPCSKLLAEHHVSEVVIGCRDTFSKVSGKGIEQIKAAGIKTRVGILEKEARNLNKRFFTFHEKKRPYIILKWAQTADAFMDKLRADDSPKGLQNRISGELSKMLVHKWRSEEAGILAGTNTALNDNPQLNVRDWHGKQPIRMVTDRNLQLPKDLHLFDNSVKTMVFTELEKESDGRIGFVKVDFNKLPEEICRVLYDNEIQSLIVEGGRKLLDSFINAGLWDEARVFVSPKFWHDGLSAPVLLNGLETAFEKCGDDELFLFYNTRL